MRLRMILWYGMYLDNDDKVPKYCPPNCQQLTFRIDNSGCLNVHLNSTLCTLILVIYLFVRDSAMNDTIPVPMCGS